MTFQGLGFNLCLNFTKIFVKKFPRIIGEVTVGLVRSFKSNGGMWCTIVGRTKIVKTDL